MTVSYAFHSESSEKLSANNEIEIEINDSKVYIGIGGKKLYYKSSKDAEIEYLGEPACTVIAFAGKKPPKGYLLCDGREVEVSRYPDLFVAIGTIYGGNASSKFKLPDFRGMFLRGTGGNAEPLGRPQGDAIRNIQGTAWMKGVEYRYIGYSGCLYITASPDNDSEGHHGGRGSQINFDASRGSGVSTANENRPVNYVVSYCVKY
ncbi:MAG: phage tail protein [Endomicrobium sp.]|uniref:phage tail protein n=1 Tax=Candidatus Endomicrobiellum pyrsonymphae TaxID=1408203 RepID=UPI0035865E42|nr:phage tail protein [Endomicrobium sp.]